jgi:tellurite resistance protein TerC
MPAGTEQFLTYTLAGTPVWLWLAFHAIVFALLGVDFFLTRDAIPLPVVERRSHWMTVVWIVAAMLFAVLIYRELSQQHALEYLTGYGIEESLSIDNLFVFLVLFQSFGLRARQQRYLLFFGVAGAIVLRAVLIFAGIRLLDAFSWMNYIFGALLLYTAWHLLQSSRKPESEATPKIASWLSRHLPVASRNFGNHFFIQEEANGRRRLRMTPLFVALVAIETTDLLFAMDSIPAVLAVSNHPFIVYSSNIFAVFGLRSLYFTLAALLNRLHKLRYGLVAILAFVGLKMMLSHVYAVPTWISLLVLAWIIAIASVWSLVSKPERKPKTTQSQ